MSSEGENEESKRNEEPERAERSIRELFVEEIRRLIPSRCNFFSTPQPGPSSGGDPQSSSPKPDLQQTATATESGEPSITVLHVRGSIPRTSQYPRPPDFSAQDSETEVTISPPPGPPKVIYGPPPLEGAPPSYSAVMRLGTYDFPPPCCGRRREFPLQPSPPFIAPVPPPTYAEAEGYFVDTASVEQIGFGPQSAAVICPTCGTFVMTTIERRSSNLTHFSAAVLCMCGCWPCCLVPYCVDTCKIIHHRCPGCHQLLGVYRPW